MLKTLWNLIIAISKVTTDFNQGNLFYFPACCQYGIAPV